MLKKLTGAIVALAGLFGMAMQTAPASAMPMVDRAPAIIGHAAPLDEPLQIRWACEPYRCLHRGNGYSGYGRPHFYYPPPAPRVSYRPEHRWYRPHFDRPVAYNPYRHRYGARYVGFYRPHHHHFRHHGYHHRPYRWHHRGYGYHHHYRHAYHWHRYHHRHFYGY